MGALCAPFHMKPTKILTPWQLRILYFLYEDKSLKTIAAILGVEDRNISNAARYIYQKMGVTTRTGLLAKKIKELS